MHTIQKEITFHAAHRLPMMPDGHQCQRLHGHTYKVIVSMSSRFLDDKGMVLDYGILSDMIKGQFDHQYLGSGDIFMPVVGKDEEIERIVAVLGDAPTTAEVLAVTIYGQLKTDIIDKLNEGEPAEKHVFLNWVEVHETETSVARYTPS